MRLLKQLVIMAGLALAPAPGFAESIPFSWDWSRADQSAIDLSHFLEAPAGKDGFVRVKQGHFVQPNGQRLRLWGVNVAASSCFPPKEQAPLIAADLARLGFNVVRFHHLDADWGQCLFVSQTNHTRTFDAANLDRLDFFIAELKKRGIYFSLTMNVHRQFKEGDGVRDWKMLGIGKAATYFNPRLIELQQEFTRNLLTHRNPYTGAEYRHEPALLSIEMVNENSLLEAWCQWRLVGNDEKAGDTWSPIPVSYANELTEQFNQWLGTRRSPEQLAALRAETKVGAGQLIPRLMPNQFTNASPLRFHSEAEFLMGVESNFFAGMKRLIQQELGAKSLLFGSGDHNDWFAGYAHVRNMLQLDIVDGHGYWEHPEIGKLTRIKNTPMVNDPLDSTFVQFARTPVLGKPFTISEVNHPFPHQFAAEGYVTLTAYALFQDWDGIVWFDWEQGRMADPKSGISSYGWFDVSRDPVKLAQITAAGLMWHRRDVAQAKKLVVRAYAPTDLIEAMRMNQAKERPFFTPGFARSTPLQHATRWTLEKKATSSFPPAAPLNCLESDTRELRWLHADRKQGVVTVNTPASQALIGFLRAGGEAVPHLAADLRPDFCAVTLTSLDQKPIGRSRKLLLVATPGAATNSGQRFAEDGKTLAEWGKGPLRVETVTGTVTLRELGKVKSLRVHPLTPEGCLRETTIPATQLGREWRVELGEPGTTWWVVEVER